jgi:hypothetical protein
MRRQVARFVNNSILMTLGNMRANGVRAVAVWCLGRDGNHHRVIKVNNYPDDVPSRAVSPASRFLPASRNSFDQR